MFREFVIAKRIRAEQHERDKWAVWHTAALSRREYKLTPFDQFMRGNKPQSADEQAAMWRDISASLGGTWKKFDRKRSRVIGLRRRNGG